MMRPLSNASSLFFSYADSTLEHPNDEAQRIGREAHKLAARPLRIFAIAGLVGGVCAEEK